MNEKSNTPIIIGVVIFLAIIGAALVSIFALSNGTEDPDPVQENNPVVEESDNSDQADSADDIENIGETNSSPGLFTFFEGDDSVSEATSFANSNSDDGDTNLIFFHAQWCPTCRSLENDLNENLSEIPGDINIFGVDYDTYDELKDMYDVRFQHTIVEIDADGNEIRKLQAPTNNLEQLLRSLDIS